VRSRVPSHMEHGYKMKYVQSGKLDGPTIIFIHGWPDTELVWKYQLEVLEANYRCVCLMLPGYELDAAGSQLPYFGISLENIASDAVAMGATCRIPLVKFNRVLYIRKFCLSIVVSLDTLVPW